MGIGGPGGLQDAARPLKCDWRPGSPPGRGPLAAGGYLPFRRLRGALERKAGVPWQTLFPAGDGGVLSVSPEAVQAAERAALETLGVVQALCGEIQQAERTLERDRDTARFFRATWPWYQHLLRRVNALGGEHSKSHELIRLATANDNVEPIRFRGESALTAHEAAFALAVEIESDYDLHSWDEETSDDGEPYAEHLRLRDCRRLVDRVRDVTPELLKTLQQRIEIESLKARRFLLDHKKQNEPAAPPAETPKLWPRSPEWETILGTAERWEAEARRLCGDFHPHLIRPERPPNQFRADTQELVDWCSDPNRGIDPSPLGRLLGELSAPSNPAPPRYGERLRALWGDCERVLQRLRFQGLVPLGAVPTDKNKPRITREEANLRAREALKNRPPKAKRWSIRKLADAIGCSPGLAASLPAWQAYAVDHGLTRRDAAPKAVSLTDATLGSEGQRDAKLEKLIAEHEAEFEESPLISQERKRRPKRRIP